MIDLLVFAFLISMCWLFVFGLAVPRFVEYGRRIGFQEGREQGARERARIEREKASYTNDEGPDILLKAINKAAIGDDSHLRLLQMGMEGGAK